ncbi:hypothetical protein AHMF7605_08270 [Adhaeribacter arboris]|uniref:Uncharacterized protein n=1 Tax=Adhaeribacter arboris TaxID=2072846 RepID=A0A2T2YDC0_9BACT|nr:hypothetical protein [Adhaeribacter arboris]PSR53520.1 hypothetical protein AHMF7605_08270 [Adhaeribacter arboris]
MKPKSWPPLSPAADNNSELETYFKTLQEVDYTASFPQTAAWVRQRHYSKVAAIPWWLALRLFLFGSTFRVAYTVLFLVSLVGACNYPVEVNEPIGTVLRWEVNDPNEATVTAINQLPWLQEDQLVVKKMKQNGHPALEYTYTLPALKKEVVQNYQQNLAQISGVRNLAVLPITHQTSQPLYETALENLLRIEMDATHISDADLKKTVEAKFQEQGLTGIDINIIRDASGQRMITTKLPEKPGRNYGFDLTLKDGQRHTRLKEQVKFRNDPASPDFKTMTDEQIKAFIIRDHPNLPLAAEDIKITRNGDDILISINDKKGNQLKLRVK